MKCNIGKTDRMIRILLGIVIVILGFSFQSWWGLVGLVPLLTAAFRWCPLYVPLNVSTDETDAQ